MLTPVITFVHAIIPVIPTIQQICILILKNQNITSTPQSENYPTAPPVDSPTPLLSNYLPQTTPSDDRME